MPPQAKEDASGSGHPNPGGFGEKFYTSGSRMGLLIRLGCAQGLYSFNLASGGLLMSFSGFLNLASAGLLWGGERSIFHLLGNLVS